MGLRDDDLKGLRPDVRMHGAGPELPPDPAQASIGGKNPEAVLEALRAIARSVALDSSLKVELGQPGQGSYCQFGGPAALRTDRAIKTITIDPLHVLDEGNAFIIAHEGMHAYVDSSPFDTAVHLPLKQACDPEALYHEVGFASLLNYLADCGGNTWLASSYPAFKEPLRKLYDSMLTSENPEMHSGETKAITARLGFFPRFAQFGSEIMKRWHTGLYSERLDPSVQDALKNQEGNTERFIKCYPEKQLSQGKEREALFVERFLIAALRIMPTVRALAEKDKAQAGMQQFLNEQNRSGGAGAAAQLSPETQREVSEQTAAHRESLREELQKQLDDLSKYLDGQAAKATASQAPANSTDQSQQIEELRRKINEKFDDAADKDAKREAERVLDGLEKLKDSIDSQAAPIDKLSESAQSELKQLYDDLDKADRQRLEKQGEDLLKELEDAIREQLEGKFQKAPAPTHKQNSEASDLAAQAAEAYRQAREAAKRMEELRQSKLSLWDAALESVSDSVQKLYSRLENILLPPPSEWDSGHATGGRPNLLTTMQARADPKLRSKIWEKKEFPMERQFVFSLLVDNSGSMQSQEQYLYARQCAVLLSTVLTMLKVPFEISSFSEGSTVLKKFDEKPSRERKNEIGGAINGKGGGTHDYDAVRECVQAIGARSEENKFLIVITDGGSSNGEQLQEALKDALESHIRVVGLGIGSGTTDVDRYYPIGRGGLSLDPKDKEAALGPYFSKLLEQILKNPQQFVAKALREKAAKRGGV